MPFVRFFSLVRLALVLPLFLLFSCGGGDGGGSNTTSGGATSLSITWPSFPSTGILGIISDALDNPVISPAPDSFTITSKTETCQWDDIAKKISFNSLGNCTLTVTANKQGFPEKMQDFTVKIFGKFSSNLTI